MHMPRCSTAQLQTANRQILLHKLGTHGRFIISRPSSGAEPKARNMSVMNDAPRMTRTPPGSAGVWFQAERMLQVLSRAEISGSSIVQACRPQKRPQRRTHLVEQAADNAAHHDHLRLSQRRDSGTAATAAVNAHGLQ